MRHTPSHCLNARGVARCALLAEDSDDSGHAVSSSVDMLTRLRESVPSLHPMGAITRKVALAYALIPCPGACASLEGGIRWLWRLWQGLVNMLRYTEKQICRSTMPGPRWAHAVDVCHRAG